MKKLFFIAFLLTGLNSFSQTTFKVDKVWWNTNNTLVTEVTYMFSQDTVTVAVPHFQPKSKTEVFNGIKNRGFTEKAILSADSIIRKLIPSVLLDTNKIFILQ